MKAVLTITLLLGIVLNVSAQSCNSLHTGKFKVSDDETGITLITRNEKYQIEENKTLGFKMIFSITWIDECVYELRPEKVIEGDPLYMEKDIIVTAEITKVKSHGYQAVCSTNFTTEKKTLIVEILE